MKKHFFLKLIPPRGSFMQDMTDSERNIMQRHIAYWKIMMDKGIVLVFGPVMDPLGGYGVGVVEVESDDQLQQIIDRDPANGLNRYEWFPMKAITPQG